MDLFEDYVSYDTAKLLKEKGFDESIETLIRPEEIIYHLDENSISRQIHSTISNSEINIYSEGVSCPTIQMAMKWLREVHKFYIEFVLNQDVQDEEAAIENYYIFNVSRLDRFANEGGDCKMYDSYEEACDAAIRYCLVNLI